MSEFFRRFRYLFNRRRFDQELANDMEFHREMAAREGRQNFGSTLRLREGGHPAQQHADHKGCQYSPHGQLVPSSL